MRRKGCRGGRGVVQGNCAFSPEETAAVDISIIKGLDKVGQVEQHQPLLHLSMRRQRKVHHMQQHRVPVSPTRISGVGGGKGFRVLAGGGKRGTWAEVQLR